MTRKLTFLILALFALIAGPGWGQTKTDYTELFTVTSDDVVTNSGYTAYTTTVGNRDWIITFGGNNKSVGTNSSNRSKCNLSSYSKYAVSPVTTSDVASAFVSTSSISDVSKISYTFGGGSNQANTNVYLIYSSDGNTFSQISLTSGTQGAAISSGTAYEFTKCSGYFGLLFKATNSSGNWRIDDVNITFYKSQTASNVHTLFSVVSPENAGSITLATADIEEGSTTTAQANANSHFSFASWNITGAGASLSSITENPTTVTMGTEDATITANFNEDPKYDVVYNANNGTAATSTQSQYAGEDITIASNTFTYEGHKFVNWNTAVDGSGDSYEIGGSYTMTTLGLTLYAQWEETSEVEFTYDFTDLNNFYTNPEMTDHPQSSSSNQYLTLYYENGDVFTTSSTSSSYFASYQDNTYFILGKSGAIMNLPTKSGYKITQIKFKSTTSHSKNVTVSIFSGENEVSTEQKWEIQDHEYIYDIASAYQNDRLSIKVTNDYNTQFESITLVCEPSTASIITVDPASLSIPAGGEDFGTISVEYTNFVPEIGVVEFYSDQACTSITVPDWILADFATGSTTSIEYMADENTTFESRSVFMKITLLDEDENELSTIIPVTQEGHVQTFTATISINGTVNTTEGITEIVLPANETAPADFTFAGWTTTESDVDPTHFVSGTVQLTANRTFYAVFSRVEGGSSQGSGNYEKVTSALTDWSGEYLIVYEDENEGITTAKVFNGKDEGHDYITATITNNVIASDDGEDGTDSKTVEIASMEGGYSIMIKSGDNAGKYISGTSGSNKLNFSDEAKLNTITFDGETKTATITSNTSVLRFNTDSGDSNDRFRYYKSTSTSFPLVYLYKKAAGTPGVTHYYTRVYDVNTTIDDALTVQGPSIILSGKTLTVTGTMSNTDPANLVIDDGGQLVMYNSETDEPVLATVRKNITGYTGDNDNYYLIANPTDNTTVANLINPEGYYDLYTFNPAQALEWNYEKESNTLTSGIGYLYANKATTTLEFVGALTPAGSSKIELTYANAGTGIDFPGFNLIGNPYTCNAYIDGSFYRMNGTKFVSVANGPISPCEGIFVEASEDGEELAITTTAASKGANLELAISQGRSAVIDRAIVNFNGSNNLHKFMMNPAHTNLSIAKGSETFAAISTEAEGELPVNFKAEKNGTYTITVNTKNVDAEYLHLIDNMTGMDVDLLSTPSYTFEAKTSDYASRFKLVFGVKNEASESSDSNFAFMSNGNLVIDNIEGEATLQIVDELGRVISTETVSGSYNKALNLKAGLYIINLNGMTQKIVVK